MAAVPSLPLFVDDYEAATAHLTLEEDGAYLRLLRLCWRTPGCSMPDDPAWIARKMRVDDATFERVVAPIIREFFSRSRGRLLQKRLRAEFGYVSELSRARKEAGKKGGLSKAQKTKGNGNGKATDLLELIDSKLVAPTLTPTPKVEEIPLDEESNGAEVDSDRVFWSTAKAYLGANKASLIGQWVRDHGREATASAIAAAQVERAIDPVQFIVGRFRHQAKVESGHAERPIC